MRYSWMIALTTGLAGTALVSPVLADTAGTAPVDTYQPFSTHLLSAQSRNHLLGEIASGSEDNVDLTAFRFGGEFDVADFRVAGTPVELSLLGRLSHAEVEFDTPGNGPKVDADTDIVEFGAKGAWVLPAVPALSLGTGAVLNIVNFEGSENADDSETGVVAFGSARYTITPRFAAYGTVLASTEDRAQDSGAIAGVLFDLGEVALGAEVSTPGDTAVTPFVTWAPGPRFRLNGGIDTGTEPDPVFRGQISYLLGAL